MRRILISEFSMSGQPVFLLTKCLENVLSNIPICLVQMIGHYLRFEGRLVRSVSIEATQGESTSICFVAGGKWLGLITSHNSDIDFLDIESLNRVVKPRTTFSTDSTTTYQAVACDQKYVYFYRECCIEVFDITGKHCTSLSQEFRYCEGMCVYESQMYILSGSGRVKGYKMIENSKLAKVSDWFVDHVLTDAREKTSEKLAIQNDKVFISGYKDMVGVYSLTGTFLSCFGRSQLSWASCDALTTDDSLNLLYVVRNDENVEEWDADGRLRKRWKWKQHIAEECRSILVRYPYCYILTKNKIHVFMEREYNIKFRVCTML